MFSDFIPPVVSKPSSGNYCSRDCRVTMCRKKIMFMLAIALSGCTLETMQANTRSNLSCNVEYSHDKVIQMLEARKDCSSCLLQDAIRVMKSCPDDHLLTEVAMYSALRSRRYDESVSFYELLVSRNVASEGNHSDAGYVYLQQRQFNMAVLAFEEAVRQGADPFVQFELAKLLRQEGRASEAAVLLRRIVEENRPLPKQGELTVISYDAIADEAKLMLDQIDGETTNRTKD